MRRRARPLLCGVGALCVVAGLFPGSRGRPEESTLGLPFSPLFRSRQETVEQERSVTSENGFKMESSRHSSTVYDWEVRVFSWSTALVCLGLVLIVAPLRAAWKEGAAHARVEDGGS